MKISLYSKVLWHICKHSKFPLISIPSCHMFICIAPSSDHPLLTLNLPFIVILSRFEGIFWCLAWECCTFQKIYENSFKFHLYYSYYGCKLNFYIPMLSDGEVWYYSEYAGRKPRLGDWDPGLHWAGWGGLHQGGEGHAASTGKNQTRTKHSPGLGEVRHVYSYEKV